MKTILSILILGLLMALTASAGWPVPQCVSTNSCLQPLPTIDCGPVCASLTGFSYLWCMTQCTAYNLTFGADNRLPKSLQDNPWFAPKCPAAKPEPQVFALLDARRTPAAGVARYR